MDTASEAGFGVGQEAAIAGMRPIVEVMTVNSVHYFDQIVNNAATLLHMSGGQVHVRWSYAFDE
jgi:pyruvate dehydrogenase E1 component beta subunit